MLATEWNVGNVLWTMLVLFFWVMAIWIFIAIFSDIFRRNDLSGWAKAGWIFLIFIVPFLGALIYVIASRRIAVLARRPIVCGALYGAGIYFAMNYVIVPLSNATLRHTFNLLMVLELLVHMFLVGVIIALFARRAS